MSENSPVEIKAKAVERVTNPATGQLSVRVRLTHTTPEGPDCEWSIWIPDEESFDKAVDLARKQLHQISAKIASQPASVDDLPVVDVESDGRRVTIRTPRGRPGGWMGS